MMALTEADLVVLLFVGVAVWVVAVPLLVVWIKVLVFGTIRFIGWVSP